MQSIQKNSSSQSAWSQQLGHLISSGAGRAGSSAGMGIGSSAGSSACSSAGWRLVQWGSPQSTGSGAGSSAGRRWLQWADSHILRSQPHWQHSGQSGTGVGFDSQSISLQRSSQSVSQQGIQEPSIFPHVPRAAKVSKASASQQLHPAWIRDELSPKNW